MCAPLAPALGVSLLWVVVPQRSTASRLRLLRRRAAPGRARYPRAPRWRGLLGAGECECRVESVVVTQPRQRYIPDLQRHRHAEERARCGRHLEGARVVTGGLVVRYADLDQNRLGESFWDEDALRRHLEQRVGIPARLARVAERAVIRVAAGVVGVAGAAVAGGTRPRRRGFAPGAGSTWRAAGAALEPRRLVTGRALPGRGWGRAQDVLQAGVVRGRGGVDVALPVRTGDRHQQGGGGVVGGWLVVVVGERTRTA